MAINSQATVMVIDQASDLAGAILFGPFNPDDPLLPAQDNLVMTLIDGSATVPMLTSEVSPLTAGNNIHNVDAMGEFHVSVENGVIPRDCMIPLHGRLTRQ